MNKTKILIATGGTGGHVFPAYSLAKFMIKNNFLVELTSDARGQHFLKNYTIPFVQLDPSKTILVFAHQYNTFDKRKLLKNPHPMYVKETKLKVKNFIRKNSEAINFYINI